MLTSLRMPEEGDGDVRTHFEKVALRGAGPEEDRARERAAQEARRMSAQQAAVEATRKAQQDAETSAAAKRARTDAEAAREQTEKRERLWSRVDWGSLASISVRRLGSDSTVTPQQS